MSALDRNDPAVSRQDRYHPRMNAGQWVLVVLAALAMLATLAVGWFHLVFPFQLEWMEGSLVDGVVRLHQGKPLYVEPNTFFTPYIYTPFYYYVAAAVDTVLGRPLAALRFVSLLSMLAAYGLIALLVKRETGRWWTGVVAAGLYASALHYLGNWYVLARVDSLFVALLLATVERLQAARGARGLVVAGIVGFLAAYTKQTAIGLILLLVPWVWVVHRKRMVWFLGSFLLAAGLATGVEQAVSRGWFLWYTFALPRDHSLLMPKLLLFVRENLAHLPVLAVLAVGETVFLLRRPVNPRRLLLPFAFLALLLISWVSRLHSGGFINVNMPFAAGAALLAGVALGELEGWGEGGRGWKRTLLSWGLPLLVLVQFALLAWRPAWVLPGEADVASRKGLVRFLASAPGRIWAPSFGYLVREEGFAPQAHTAALFDVLRARVPESELLRAKLLQRIADPKIGGALFHDLERKQWMQLMPGLRDVFVPRGVLGEGFPLVAGGYDGDPLVFCTKDQAAVDSLLATVAPTLLASPDSVAATP